MSRIVCDSSLLHNYLAKDNDDLNLRYIYHDVLHINYKICNGTLVGPLLFDMFYIFS